MGEEGDRAGGWHLDKRVPIAIILAIFVQTAGVVWWAARLENRVVTLEKANTEIATDLAARAIVTGPDLDDRAQMRAFWRDGAPPTVANGERVGFHRTHGRWECAAPAMAA